MIPIEETNLSRADRLGFCHNRGQPRETLLPSIIGSTRVMDVSQGLALNVGTMVMVSPAGFVP